MFALEEFGNILSRFSARYFETMLDSGGFPVAESSAPGGRYPKQWHLPEWQAILAREDVEWVGLPMCALGLGPPDEPDHFYVHRTRVVFPRHAPLRQALQRRRRGIGPHHQPLKGCGEGTVLCHILADLLEDLRSTVSSPFETVDKMMPDRTISEEKRIVHDQRGVNPGASEFLHPPALQPAHVQVARRILWHKVRCPKIPVLMSKKDAFRLLWLAPVTLSFLGATSRGSPSRWKVMWRSRVSKCEHGITVLYLVSSFGFSGSPGEWSMFGRATAEYHRAHRPAEPRQHLRAGFDAKVLVDDCILVEPMVGLRPWTLGERGGFRARCPTDVGTSSDQRREGQDRRGVQNNSDSMGPRHGHRDGEGLSFREAHPEGSNVAGREGVRLWRADPYIEAAAAV